MQSIVAIFLRAIIVGCSRSPSKQAHVKQVRDAIQQAGGKDVILKEPKLFYPRRHLKTDWFCVFITRSSDKFSDRLYTALRFFIDPPNKTASICSIRK